MLPVVELIDTDRHGWDAEMGGIVATKRGEGEPSEYECDECGRTTFSVWTRFEYPGDLFDTYEKQYRGREPDLFSWFSLMGQCSGCSRLLPLTDFECA